jgi:hypothetical protein
MAEMRLLIQSHIPEMERLTSDEEAGIMRNVEDLRFYSVTADKDTKEIASIEICHKETREDRENAVEVSLTCSVIEPQLKIICVRREFAFELRLVVKRQTPQEYTEDLYVSSSLSRDDVSKVFFGKIVPL